MCRLLLYKGKQPILLAHLLTNPAHSIINQSFDSKLRLDHRRPLNGDGFGVGWYDSEPDKESRITPCIFTSVTPAWNNTNLVRLAEKIKSPLVFAHVRASTSGAVTEANCHPWHYGRIMWMHNGGIAEFDKIKRKLQATLPDELFLFVQGNTDSEWAFALFLSFLSNPNADTFEHHELKHAMIKTIAQLNAWAEEAGIVEQWAGQGSKTNCIHGSEPLTFEKADWLTIPTNNILVITPKLNVLLQPIKDKFYTSDRGAEVKDEAERIPEPEPESELFKAQMRRDCRMSAGQVSSAFMASVPSVVQAKETSI
ncbi:hypothetical protein DFQ29_003695 [Apophysomyces sp. BC1021]|nr:hypothetical protein DFQ29_003695 [Apophysomyces sp. BC1021]